MDILMNVLKFIFLLVFFILNVRILMRFMEWLGQLLGIKNLVELILGKILPKE